MDGAVVADCVVKTVEVDELPVINPQDCSVVGDHPELVIAGITNPKHCVVVDPGQVGSWCDAGNPVRVGEGLVRNVERVGVDRTNRIEFAEVRQATGRMFQFINIATEGIGSGSNRPEGTDGAFRRNHMDTLFEEREDIEIGGGLLSEPHPSQESCPRPKCCLRPDRPRRGRRTPFSRGARRLPRGCRLHGCAPRCV